MVNNINILNRTSTIDQGNVELYDSDVKAIMDGPMAWFNARTGSWRNIDDMHKELTEQFQKIGLQVEVSVWTLGECRCRPATHHAEQCRNLIAIPEAYQFGVLILGKINRESGFDFDKMVHEVQHNLLDIPGEGGVIKFDEKEWLRNQGTGGGSHKHH